MSDKHWMASLQTRRLALASAQNQLVRLHSEEVRFAVGRGPCGNFARDEAIALQERVVDRLKDNLLPR